MSNGKKFSVKKGNGQRQESAYPVTVCSTRYKDPNTGRWVSPPANSTAGKTRKGSVGMVLVKHKDNDGQVVGVRAVMGDARQAQRRGKLSKAAVREMEKDMSRDALEHYNPGRARELDLERMHEAHRSDKAKRGAATRKKNAAAGRGKKARPLDVIRTDLLRTEQLVKDAQRRHAGAKSVTTKSKYAQTVKTRTARLAKLRAELAKAQK